MNSIAANGVTALRVADLLASSLFKRVLSALILAPVALLFVWAGGTAFATLLAVVGVLMAVEWERLTGGMVRDRAGFLQLAGAILAVAAATFVGAEAGLAIIAAAAVGTLVLARDRGPWPAVGAAYIGLPLVSLVVMRDLPDEGLVAVIWLLAVVWSMDVFAYVAGRSIGGPKLAPAISPNKTWAGLIGGTIASMIAGAVIAPYVGAETAIFALFSGALGIFSQLGDLFESHIKRRFGVKDSGNLIPGHGGILDRVDGLVFAAVGLGILTALFGSPLGLP